MTILYRRTRAEMPAFKEEIEAALEEGVELMTLVSPVKICSQDNRLSGVECLTNTLGEIDAGGRRRPIAVPGSEHLVEADTLIIAIGETPDTDEVCLLSSTGPARRKNGSAKGQRAKFSVV